MDPSEYVAFGRPSPRREVHLQGPRPSPLKVRKDSYKIKKPPVAPPGGGPSQSQHPPPHAAALAAQRPREPVIIYTVSPKVIHIEPREFMSLVQRLTGASPTALSGPAADSGMGNAMSYPSPVATGAISPAARLATIERAGQMSAGPNRSMIFHGDDFVEQQLGIGGGGAATLDRAGSFPGILSPLPSALPPFSPNIFSPAVVDPSTMSFLNEMSPVFRPNNTNNSNIFTDGPFLPSPGNFLSTPILPSPGAYWDFISQL
ncbi:unnamed protein product [Spirodela intermedia]|uniref:VQ domain-containing protein n=2 Tax=Spirodela intermedia TaxID=51605 RepID=A0A7I8JE13_SPIIN|nr:unnamed protein product [Spirodela intermedia]CAA6667632.1 unnamed protein product [Spirodela intermedia]CAA7404449.1 unnamed protein product [Spirodela intermedia]